MKTHTSHALDMNYVRETPNYHRLEVPLKNGRIWYIYVPKNPRRNPKVYVGSFQPVDTEPQSAPCTCEGPHYHAPLKHKKKCLAHDRFYTESAPCTLCYPPKQRRKTKRKS